MKNITGKQTARRNNHELLKLEFFEVPVLGKQEKGI
jgi:hypothetical protein